MIWHAIIWGPLLFFVTLLPPSIGLGVAEETAPGRTLAQQATKASKLWITADHAKHAALQQSFTSGPEVTRACLSCHSEAAAQFHKTIHWTWRDPATAESRILGKGGLSINNF
jgi:uncharacterized paraquat-inducible protein A